MPYPIPTIQKRLKELLALVVSTTLAAAPTAQAALDDTVLFSTIVPPNVVLLVDNSGSMNNIVWHPDFKLGLATCAYWTDDTWYQVKSTDTDTSLSASDTTFKTGTYTLPATTGCITTAREIFEDPLNLANGEATWWQGSYLNWLFSSVSNSAYSEIIGTNNGTYSSCVGGGIYDLYRRSRITAAKAVLRQVICEVNTTGAVRFGIAKFRDDSSDPNGGYIVVPAEDYLDASGGSNSYSLNGSTKTHAQHLDDAINKLTPDVWTPLGETLFQIYTYFMDRDSSKRPSRGGKTFPEYEYKPSDGSRSTAGSPTVPDSPVENGCQRNFVIIITDGEPTKDDFDSSGGSTDIGFSDFGTLIGDYIPGDEIETPTATTECPGGSSYECGRYLDDIAKYMQDNDFLPDVKPHNGQEQVIDVYTIGFTTSASANDLLKRTAAAGNGTFNSSSDPAALAGDIVDAISDIIQKSQSFTAATVPATRTADGGQFYTSLFVPANSTGYWEGHLKSWQITAAGEILDKDDKCALNDPGAPTTCVAGTFKSSALPYWDAGDVLAATSPAARKLLTSRLVSAGTSGLISFDSSTVTAADLGVTAGDISAYDTTPYTAPTDADELRTVIVDSLRGCELGSTGGSCVERSWKLGDIFHSDPVVVAGPASYRQDLDYRAFQAKWEERDRVILGGANDGFLRFFDAGAWDTTNKKYTVGTGAERIGFMPYATRQVAKDIPLEQGGRDIYGVDGSPSVADVWFYTSASANAPQDGTEWAKWRTVVVGGLRQGGEAYYAMDITDPDATSCSSPATGSKYPCYLWEFPREDATGGTADYMAETWSEAIITKVRVNPSVTSPVATTPYYDRWVAIFGTGYSEESDPNDDAEYDVLSKEGRAIVMVDIKTGQVLAEKKFDPTGSSSTTNPAAFTYDAANPEQSMHYAITASPAVFDLDFDGYADTIYIPDLGGNVWKWNIGAIGQDPINGSGSATQPNWSFRKYFAAPTHFESGTPSKTYYKSMYFAPSATMKSGNLWLVVGTGERTNLTFAGLSSTTAENNRLYTLIDSDPMDRGASFSPIAETDLLLLPPNTSCADLTSYDGYYFLGAEAEKFITRTDIFSFVVLTASYVPTSSSNPCTSSGLAKLYAYRISCGEGVFQDTSGSGTPSVSVDLGSGMPTSPQVTISSGGYSGSGSAPSPNKVIINNQDGEVVVPGSGDLDGDGKPDCPGATCPCPNWPNDCPLPDSNGGISQFYWREL